MVSTGGHISEKQQCPPPTHLEFFEPGTLHLLLNDLLLLRRQCRAQVRWHLALEFARVRRPRLLLGRLELRSCAASVLVVTQHRLVDDSRMFRLPTRLPRGLRRLGLALRAALGGRLPYRGADRLLEFVQAERLEARLVAGSLFQAEQLVLAQFHLLLGTFLFFVTLVRGHGDSIWIAVKRIADQRWRRIIRIIWLHPITSPRPHEKLQASRPASALPLPTDFLMRPSDPRPARHILCSFSGARYLYLLQPAPATQSRVLSSFIGTSLGEANFGL